MALLELLVNMLPLERIVLIESVFFRCEMNAADTSPISNPLVEYTHRIMKEKDVMVFFMITPFIPDSLIMAMSRSAKSYLLLYNYIIELSIFLSINSKQCAQ